MPGSPLVDDDADVSGRRDRVDRGGDPFDVVFGLECVGEEAIVLLIVGLRDGHSLSVIVVQCQVVERELGSPRRAGDLLHEAAVPLVAFEPAGDEFEVLLDQQVVHGPDISRIPAILSGVLLRCHPATTAPVFVSEAPVFDAIGVFAAVFATAVCQFGVSLIVTVLDPVCRLLWVPGADVGREIRLRANAFAVLEEFVTAKSVRFFGGLLGSLRPEEIPAARSVFLRTDAVFPVIIVRETAARPSQDGKFEVGEQLESVLAKSVLVGAVTVPDTAVDTASQVFGEVAVDLGRDTIDRCLRMYCYTCVSHALI